MIGVHSTSFFVLSDILACAPCSNIMGGWSLANYIGYVKSIFGEFS